MGTHLKMAQNVNPTTSRIHDQADKDSLSRNSGAATQQVSKRLQSELMTLMMSGDKGISAFPEGDNLLSWIGTVEGPIDSVYEGLKYKLRLEFPAGYPYQSPSVKFTTPCFHPNVDNHDSPLNTHAAELWSNQVAYKKFLIEKYENDTK